MSVTSEIELAGFVAAPSQERPDIDVRAGVVSAATVDAGRHHVIAEAPGVLRAVVADGERLVVEVNPDAGQRFVGAVVAGELFSALLRQRGKLVLHGSGVARDGVAVGFVGDSGWGKSTLAAALVQRGWSLLTDDLLVVDGLLTADTVPTVIPSHPSMRLSPEAADTVVGPGQTRGGAAHERTTKVQVEWAAAFSTQPTPLAYVFVLDPRPSETHEAVRLQPRAAMAEFLRHTRALRLLTSTASLQEHFTQCARLARDVPSSALRRMFGLHGIGGLCDQVEAEVVGISHRSGRP